MTINVKHAISDFKKIVFEGTGLDSITSLYSGSDSFGDLTEFVEYDFEYKVKSVPYNSHSVFSLTSDGEINDLLPALGTLEKVYFPTLIDTSAENDRNYFGSVKINEQRAYLIDVPEGYSTVKIWDEFEPSESEEDIEITLSDDVEINSRNIILLVFNYNNAAIENINLSVKAWTHSPQPARNKSDLVLRNDELLSATRYLSSPIKKDTEIDLRNGVILGFSRPNELPPILSRKLGVVEKTSLWSKAVEYQAGEECEWSGIEWVSLSSGNMGNIPSVSSMWAEKSLLTKPENYKFSITTLGDATTKTTSFPPDATEIEITLTPRPGYSLDTNTITYDPTSNSIDRTGLIVSTNNNGTVTVRASENFLDELRKSGTLYIYGTYGETNYIIYPKIWSPFTRADDGVNFGKWLSMNYKMGDDGKELYTLIETEFGDGRIATEEYRIELKRMTVDFGTVDIPENSNCISTSPGATVRYIIKHRRSGNEAFLAYRLTGETTDPDTIAEKAYTTRLDSGGDGRTAEIVATTQFTLPLKDVGFYSDIKPRYILTSAEIEMGSVANKEFDSFDFGESIDNYSIKFHQEEPYKIKLEWEFSGIKANLYWYINNGEYDYINNAREFGPEFQNYGYRRTNVMLTKEGDIYILTFSGDITSNINITL